MVFACRLQIVFDENPSAFRSDCFRRRDVARPDCSLASAVTSHWEIFSNGRKDTEDTRSGFTLLAQQWCCLRAGEGESPVGLSAAWRENPGQVTPVTQRVTHSYFTGNHQWCRDGCFYDDNCTVRSQDAFVQWFENFQFEQIANKPRLTAHKLSGSYFFGWCRGLKSQFLTSLKCRSCGTLSLPLTCRIEGVCEEKNKNKRGFVTRKLLNAKSSAV